MDSIDSNTATILKDFGKFFKENPEQKQVTPENFMAYFALLHPKIPADKREIYKAMIRDLQNPPPPGTEDGIRERLVSLSTAAQLQTLIERYTNGETDITTHLRAITERHDLWVFAKKEHPRVKDRIEDMLVDVANDKGFHWRLNCLNESMRPLWEGDFIIVAARVDTGKSSFFASELSHMAPQVDQLYPGEDRTIIVLNNEGPGKKLRHRYFNASLDATNKDLVRYSEAGDVYERYLKSQGGRDLFHVFDVHDYTMSQLEEIVRDLNPAIVVVDMLDNVTMDLGTINGGTRTDQMLEGLYQRARIWSVKYRCAVIATSQLSAEAEGELFPKLTHLANSRTGKAGAAEAVIMLGRSPNPDLDNTRFIGLPKNKKQRDGAPRDPRKEVSFDGSRALFID